MPDMCKTIKLRFACSHLFKIRLSRCRGTYTRLKRGTRIVACTADPYLTINVHLDCSPCQRSEWEKAWKQRIERAKEFLAKTKEQHHPECGAIEDLIKQLEDDYNVAAWTLRWKLPTDEKIFLDKYDKPRSKPKVQHPSPLRKEVSPIDVDLGGNKLIASTASLPPTLAMYTEQDPGPDIDAFPPTADGPISYDHPWEYLIDPDWNPEYLQDLTEDIYDQPDRPSTDDCWEGEAFGEPEWGDAVVEHATEGGEVTATDIVRSDAELVAWGPDADVRCSSAFIGMSGVPQFPAPPKDAEDVNGEFWDYVGPEPDAQSRLSRKRLHDRPNHLQKLSICRPACDSGSVPSDLSESSCTDFCPSGEYSPAFNPILFPCWSGQTINDHDPTTAKQIRQHSAKTATDQNVHGSLTAKMHIPLYHSTSNNNSHVSPKKYLEIKRWEARHMENSRVGKRFVPSPLGAAASQA